MKDCDGLRPSREGKRVSLRRQHTHCRRRAFCGRSRCRLLALGAAIRRRGGCVGQAMPKPDARTVGDRDQANLVAANRRAERASRRDAMSGARGCPLDGRVRRLLLEARRRAESGRHRRTRGQTASKERAHAYSSPRLLPGQTCRNVTGTRHRGLRAARCLRPFPDTLA